LKSIGRVNARRVFTGEFHSDNHGEFIEFLHRALKGQHPDLNLSLETKRQMVHLSEDGVDTGVFWQLPKIKKEQTGFVEFRSHDYRFLGAGEEAFCYGSALTSDNLRDFGFEVDAGEGTIQYYLEDL
jgi:hypothetical protein